MQAKRRGTPSEILAKSLAKLSEEDRAAAEWVYCEARGLPHTVAKPDRVNLSKLEEWIRRRHDAARPKIASSQYASVLEDYFNRELAVLRSFLPPRPPTLVGWEEPWPRTEIKTHADLRQYLEVQLMYLRRFGECKIGEERQAVQAAAAAMRNAMLVFDDHLEEPEWDRLRPKRWPDDPKNANRAKRVLSDLISRLSRRTRSNDPDDSPKKEQPGDGPSAEESRKRFDLLTPSVKKAYWAWQYAEQAKQKSLEDGDAHKVLTHLGFDSKELGDLNDYQLPNLDTFRHYLSKARKALGEQKYRRRGPKLTTRSVVAGGDIEQQSRDD